MKRDESIRVFVGIPDNDDPSFTYAKECVDRLTLECPFVVQGAVVRGDGVARARNNLTAVFLSTDCTHLLFHDADIASRPDHLTTLVNRCVAVVGGLYAKKKPKQVWVASALEGAARQADGLQEVTEVGTGFLLIERRVIEAMCKLPGVEYRGDPTPNAVRWDLFPMHAVDGRYLTEDWYFCKRARELGFSVYVDWSVVVGHRGWIYYPLSVSLSDEDLEDVVFHATGYPIEAVRSFLTNAPKAKAKHPHQIKLP